MHGGVAYHNKEQVKNSQVGNAKSETDFWDKERDLRSGLQEPR